MARLNFHSLPRPLTLRDGPVAFPNEPIDPGRDHIGQGLIDAVIDDLAVIGMRSGYRQSDHGRLRRGVLAIRGERNVGSFARDETRREGRVHRLLDLRHRSKADTQVNRAGALLDESPLHLTIKPHIGPAKAIDRLLRISDQKELSRTRARHLPIGDRQIVGREQEEDFHLQGIGVLELIDKEVREPLLQLRPHLLAVAQEIASADQKIGKVETPCLLFCGLVRLHDGPELVAKVRREIRASVLDKALQASVERIPSRAQLLLWEVWIIGVRKALPSPVPAANDFRDPRLQRFIIALTHALRALDLLDRLRELQERLAEVVIGIGAWRPLGE